MRTPVPTPQSTTRGTHNPDEIVREGRKAIDQMIAAANGHPDRAGMTLAEYAQAKKLDVSFLEGLGLGDVTLRDGLTAVRIPYFSEEGEERAVRYRLALDGPDRFRWKRGTKIVPYGLLYLDAARGAKYMIVTEGESDAHTCWQHGRPALGIPGAGTWREEWSKFLDGFPDIFVVIEPGGSGETMLKWIEKSSIRHRCKLVKLGDFKDPSALHINDPERFDQRLNAALDAAVPWAAYERVAKEQVAEALRAACNTVLAAPDPLDLVKAEFARLGYGGDGAPVLTTYVAVTSRVLKIRPGAMPGHLLILGVASSGKSWTVTLVLALLPEDGYTRIDAGSPRSLIYNDTDFQHRVLVYSEADSLPSGEDNAAASAIRTLLQEHRLSYDVTVKDHASGKYTIQKVRKPGPTTLLTTSIKRLGDQLDTRLFTLEAPEDVARVRAALAKQAHLELHPPTPPDPGLVTFQAYLQALAPWDVIVPFADKLAEKIGQSVAEPRITRDFTKLLSFIKAVAVLRHAHRERDADGRLIATRDDYATVRDLVNPIFEASVTRASVRLRETVEAVGALAGSQQHQGPVTVVAVARHLKIARSTAHDRIKRALDEGWLKNTGQWREGVAFDLRLGEPLPASAGLPKPEELGGDVVNTPITAERPNGSLLSVRPSADRTVTERKPERSEVLNKSDKSGEPFGRSAENEGMTDHLTGNRSGGVRTVPERRTIPPRRQLVPTSPRAQRQPVPVSPATRTPRTPVPVSIRESESTAEVPPA